jgi:Mrp family chromosome partitioning ATPase/NifU-like protein involved in Fe-S cluster formation
MENQSALKPDTTTRNSLNSPSHRDIRRVIAVTSSKGGVGKSFVTALLACRLTRMGYRVGILDADLTGSSIPMLFGVSGPLLTGQYSLLPLETPTGIKLISPNLLVEEKAQPIIWKEALSGKVIEELFKEVEWGTLDFLLLDLPPATSELAVSILQTMPIAGAVIVTQPQELSIRVVTKAVRILQKIEVDILGFVENMSFYSDSNSGQNQPLFGPSRTPSLSALAEAPVLAQIPLSPEAVRLCDQGRIEEVELTESLDLYQAFIASLARVEAENSSALEEEALRVEQPEIEEAAREQEPITSPQPVPQPRQRFSNIVLQLIQNKDNMGALSHPDAQGHFLGKCGDRMQIDLQIVNGRILDARFLADGCGATLACGSMLTKMACSKTLEQAKQISPSELLIALDGLPDDHLHCAELAVMTLREAVIDAVEGH